MTNITCCNCGIVFGVPEHWEGTRREDKRDFYCPNGHQQAFVESITDKLRRERDRLFQQVAQRDDEIKQQKKQLIKLQKRTANGVCLCCNRSFTNLRRHMATEHPEFVAPKLAIVKGK